MDPLGSSVFSKSFNNNRLYHFKAVKGEFGDVSCYPENSNDNLPLILALPREADSKRYQTPKLHRLRNRQTSPWCQNLPQSCREEGYSTLLDVSDGSLALDLIELVKTALAAAWADFAGFGPILGRFQVRVPEGPCPALAGSGVIDLALSGLVVKKDAISAGSLEQALSDTNQSNIFTFKRLDALFPQLLCHCGDFSLVHPDIAWFTGAAVAALGALKS